MNRRSVLGGIAAALAGLMPRPAKAKAQPLYVFEPHLITQVVTIGAPVYTQSFLFSTREPHQAMLAMWMMIARANADLFNIDRQIAYSWDGYSIWKEPPESPPIGSFLGSEGSFVYDYKAASTKGPSYGMPEDIEQHSPFRKEWLTHPKYFRHDFTDPYGRW